MPRNYKSSIRLTSNLKWLYLETHKETCAPGLAIEFHSKQEALDFQKSRK